MSSRLVSPSMPLRTVTRTTAVAPTRCSENSKVKLVNHVKQNITNFTTLNDSTKESSTQIVSSPLRSASLPWPVDVFVKASTEDRKIGKSSKTFAHGEKQGKIARAWEPAEKELWLERFGGPGKITEKVTGKGTVVLRDAGEDGKAYLRVLI